MNEINDHFKNHIKISSQEKVLFNELLNFLEVYIHSILYLRNVYPRDAFYTYDIYNIKLKYIIDDDVCTYISEVNLTNSSLLKV
jgi:hypothetical protein